MAITYDEHTAWFEEHCSIEEADALFAWVRSKISEAVPFRLDLSRCVHLHTALLQIVLLAPGQIVAPVALPLKACLSAIERN
jgi:hypothetical protein